MAKKIKQTSQKSLKKTLLSQIEGKLTESLKDYPKKISEKKTYGVKLTGAPLASSLRSMAAR